MLGVRSIGFCHFAAVKKKKKTSPYELSFKYCLGVA